jgi:GINS complex subunit 4
MDISDILQGLGPRPADRDPFAEDYDDLFSAGRVQQSGQADLQALTRAWVNERGAAELLPYCPSTPLSKLPSNIFPAGPMTA